MRVLEKHELSRNIIIFEPEFIFPILHSMLDDIVLITKLNTMSLDSISEEFGKPDIALATHDPFSLAFGRFKQSALSWAK